MIKPSYCLPARQAIKPLLLLSCNLRWARMWSLGSAAPTELTVFPPSTCPVRAAPPPLDSRVVHKKAASAAFLCAFSATVCERLFPPTRAAGRGFGVWGLRCDRLKHLGKVACHAIGQQMPWHRLAACRWIPFLGHHAGHRQLATHPIGHCQGRGWPSACR